MVLLPKLWVPSHARRDIVAGRAVVMRPLCGPDVPRVAPLNWDHRKFRSQRKQRGFAWLTNSYRYGQFICDAADFDGTNDYLVRGAGLTGVADSKLGILSVWLYKEVNSTGFFLSGKFDASNQYVYAQYGYGAGEHSFNVAGLLAGAPVFSMTALNVGFNTWKHWLASWDVGANVGHSYVNDVSTGTFTRFQDTDVDNTLMDWIIGAMFNGSSKLDGGLAEFYFAPEQYLDMSTEANRRKFISAAGKPVSLGADGSLPTGTAPRVYQHLDDGEAAANFATNRGTGGNFSVTGSLTTFSSSPSD